MSNFSHRFHTLTRRIATMTTPTYKELPGAEMGKVVTRFPPEPSGYLHIGHAKAALLNHFYAKQYNGTFILRFDDTNPAKENMEFEDSIKEDLRLLNVTPDRLTHTSDYFDELLQIMTRLITEEKAYVDKTERETMKIERQERIESKYRNNSVTENLRLWDEMRAGSQEGISACVRLKLNMNDKNACMRDPTMYRCVTEIPHHIHGFKYKVYPIYDFACPIVDALENVSHAMRTNEYADRIPQYYKVLELAGMEKCQIYEFSRLNFVRSVLSKRKLQWFVDQNKVTGWDDPRFPTVRGVLRRGLRVPALLEFLLEQGPSKAGVLMEWDKLWAKNKQLIDPLVGRYTAVASDAVPFLLRDGPEAVETKERPIHPKNEAMGKTDLFLFNRIFIDRDDANSIEPSEEVTLMKWGNAIIEEIEKNDKNEIIALKGRLHLEGDFKKTKKKLHWLADFPNGKLAKCVLRELDHLIIPDKIDPDTTEPFESFINPTTLFDTPALAESALALLPIGTSVQLERRGYYIFDSKSPEGEMILIKIPDGKAKAMSKVSTKVDAAMLSGAKTDEQKMSKKQMKKDQKKEQKKEKKEEHKNA